MFGLNRRLWTVGLLFFICLGPLIAYQYSQQSSSQSVRAKININTASLEELQALPRIGPAIAQRIIDYRKEHGPFKRIEDIMKVQGIGERVFEQIKERITVGPETTNR